MVLTAKIVIWNVGEFAQPLLATPSGKYRLKKGGEVVDNGAYPETQVVIFQAAMEYRI